MKTKILLVISLLFAFRTALGQGTAFTYQGRLNDGGNPAHGAYDFRFKLFADSDGNTQAGSTLLTNGYALTNGLFTVALDFGPGIFNGSNYWLEVDVRTNGGSGYSNLSPLQPILPTPYAMFANTASNVSGTISSTSLSGTYGGAVVFSNTNDSFGGSFTGNGANVTNVNAAMLNGLRASNFWNAAGNAGTTAGANFVGTTDNQPLELRVNNQRAMRLVPDGSTNNAPVIVGGSPVNVVKPGVVGATIAGGGGVIYGGLSATNTALGEFNTIGGGWGNTTGGTNFDVSEATVAGGGRNTASGISSFIGGGAFNLVYNNNAVVAGGLQNRAGFHSAVVGGNANFADGIETVVVGGSQNTVDTNAFWGTIVGGSQNAVGSGGAAGFIGGGYQNTNFGNSATISGGERNFIYNAEHAVIGGGYSNSVQSTANFSTIGGGIVNMIQTPSANSTIAGGGTNVIGSGSLNCSIGGGANNVIQPSVYAAAIAGGYQNNSAANYAAIGGGYQNIASGFGAFVGGGGYNSFIPAGNVANGEASTIAGGIGNHASGAGAFVGGGGYDGGGNGGNQATGNASVISGGYGNTASFEYSTIGGGRQNLASGDTFGQTTVAGGVNNQATGDSSTVGGGNGNTSGGALSGSATVAGGYQNNASGTYSAVAGGRQNTASGSWSAIPGGFGNTASGQYGFAAGDNAQAQHNGSFVWADSQGSSYSSDRNNQFKIRAGGGVEMDVSGSSGLNPAALYVNSTSASGVGLYVTEGSSDAGFVVNNSGTGSIIKGFNGGGGAVFEVVHDGTVFSKSVALTSDRNAKENFEKVNSQEILKKVAALAISEWNYKTDRKELQHLGPMAQDFHEAFRLDGDDDKHISVVDEGGVALAAIQGLNQKLTEKDAEIRQLQQSVAELKQMVSQLAKNKIAVRHGIKKGNMIKPFITILVGILLITAARADTPFTIGANYSCFDLFTPYAPQPAVSASFNLNGIGVPGSFQSDVSGFYNYFPEKFYKYDYKIDLSGMSPAANHCVRLIIHFGNAINCGSPDTLSLNPAVSGNPAQIASATEATHGDVTFIFAGSCLEPGQPAVNFTMVSGTPWKTNFHSVTIIDDYYDPAGGPTNEARFDVQAVVPDIPPNWAYAPTPVPNVFFQGLMTYPTNYLPPPLMSFDFAVQLFAASNGVASSQLFTQTVQVAKSGVFNMPLPFDAISMGDGSVHWLGISVRPTGSNVAFTTMGPPMPINPAPQALYAYSAGVVSDLSPGQAVTSLNGLADAVNLQAGTGVIIGTNSNTLTISTQPGVPSDREIKTDFSPVSAEKILARVAALPISSWRYTNETAGVRHVGPMAQDFRSAFSLGNGDKFIEFVDEEGVALAAIQGLNQKLIEKDAEIQQLQQSVAELKQMISHMNETKAP